MAARIVSDYDDLSQLVLVGVMDGAIFFLRDLIQELREKKSGESVQNVTARMESYKGVGPKGVRCISLPSPIDINERDVLIVDDLVNTGATCACLKSRLVKMGAKSVKICAVLYNSGQQHCAVEVDYFGFEVSHMFWVGYGLDVNGMYRDLPYIRELHPEDLQLTAEVRTETEALVQLRRPVEPL